MRKWWPVAGLLSLVNAVCAASPVVMISIDALRPETILEADRHGLKVPTLRRFVSEGAYAESVIGVFPTLTLPSHTTLITGVDPAVHGIIDNERFDPLSSKSVAYGWGRDIKVPTLWQAAADAGLKTASVWWPVSADAAGIAYNLTAPSLDAGTPHENMRLIEAISRPSDYLPTLEAKVGSLDALSDDVAQWDRLGESFAEQILLEQHPRFLTVHFSELDEAQHQYGVFQPEGAKALERIDALIGKLMQTALRVDPTTLVVVVSDHGCANAHTFVNLVKPFADAGLVTLSPPDAAGKRKIVAWKALPGGTMAVYLHNNADTEARDRTRKLLKSLQKPELGIEGILEGEAARATGGYPQAAFLIRYRPGFFPASLATADGPLLQAADLKGEHGYFPDLPEMRASFFVLGAHLPRKGDLGVIHMTQIAVSVANLLGVPFDAGGPSVFQGQH